MPVAEEYIPNVGHIRYAWDKRLQEAENPDTVMQLESRRYSFLWILPIQDGRDRGNMDNWKGPFDWTYIEWFRANLRSMMENPGRQNPPPSPYAVPGSERGGARDFGAPLEINISTLQGSYLGWRPPIPVEPEAPEPEPQGEFDAAAAAAALAGAGVGDEAPGAGIGEVSGVINNLGNGAGGDGEGIGGIGALGGGGGIGGAAGDDLAGGLGAAAGSANIRAGGLDAAGNRPAEVELSGQGSCETILEETELNDLNGLVK